MITHVAVTARTSVGGIATVLAIGCGYYRFVVVSECGNFLLCNDNVTADRALLTGGQATLGTGRCLSGNSLFNVFGAKILFAYVADIIVVRISVSECGSLIAHIFIFTYRAYIGGVAVFDTCRSCYRCIITVSKRRSLIANVGIAAHSASIGRVATVLTIGCGYYCFVAMSERGKLLSVGMRYVILTGEELSAIRITSRSGCHSTVIPSMSTKIKLAVIHTAHVTYCILGAGSLTSGTFVRLYAKCKLGCSHRMLFRIILTAKNSCCECSDSGIMLFIRRAVNRIQIILDGYGYLFCVAVTVEYKSHGNVIESFVRWNCDIEYFSAKSITLKTCKGYSYSYAVTDLDYCVAALGRVLDLAIEIDADLIGKVKVIACEATVLICQSNLAKLLYLRIYCSHVGVDSRLIRLGVHEKLSHFLENGLLNLECTESVESYRIHSNVRLKELLTVNRVNNACGTGDLVDGRVSRSALVLEGYSDLLSSYSAERNDSGCCSRCYLNTRGNCDPYSVGIYLDLSIVTSGFLSAVVEGVYRHRVERARAVESDLERRICGCACKRKSCTLVSVKYVSKRSCTGMHARVSKLKLLCSSVCEHVGARILLTLVLDAHYTGALDLIECRILRCLGIVEGDSYLVARDTAKGYLTAISRLNGKSGNNGSPYTVAVNLYLGIVTSGFLSCVIEGIEGHHIELIGAVESNLERIAVGVHVIYGISGRLVAVECIVEVRNAGVHCSTGKSELLLSSAKENILACNLGISYLIAATGHFTDTDVIAAECLT